MSETIEYKNHIIKIEQDDIPFNPRVEYDNMGTMVCFHNRYDLGDKNELGIKAGDFNSWEEMEAYLIKTLDIAVILPLYLYDHSGITMSTSPFSCRWDSGQVGFIYLTKEKIRQEYSCKYVTDKKRLKAIKCLEAEVKEYDQYLTGEVYYYNITGPDGEDEGNCGGFFGYDHKASGLLEYAENTIDCAIQYELKKHGIQMEMELA